MQHLILDEKKYKLDHCRITAKKVIIEAHTTSRFAICPKCQTSSSSIHSTYQRKPRDLPIVDRILCLTLSVRRFRCINLMCTKKTFAERLDLVGWYQHRTNRLSKSLHQIGYTLGGAGGAKLLPLLHMQSSHDTLLRLVKQAKLEEPPLPKVIGVDDWAIRKGVTYGTIIIDLETREPIELLPDRTAESLAEWLSKHPQIEIVTRDRSSEYARGITLGRPNAQQIADRWHLLLNVRQMAERWLSNMHPKLKSLSFSPELVEMTQDKRREPFWDTYKVAEDSRKSRERRIALYEQIQQLKSGGKNIKNIANALNLHWETARKYYYAKTFPERSKRPPQPTILDPYLPYLNKRLKEGCENARQMWREIKQLGYNGSAQQVTRWLSPRRSKPTPGSKKHIKNNQARIDQLKKTKKQPQLPGFKHLALLISHPPDRLDNLEKLWLEHICQNPKVKKLHHIVQRFIKIVCDRLAEDFDQWLQDAVSANIASVTSFVNGIRKDYEAIHAALKYHWSNGQVEGQVTRLKLIKRQMYGRASFELLRARVLPQ